MKRNRPTVKRAAPRPSGPELAGGVRNSLISVLMLLAGVWLFVAAWVIGYPFNEPAVDAHLNEMAVGVVVFLVAVARLVRRRGPVSDLVVTAAGAWIIAAPFVVSYGDSSKADAARINDVATGVVVIVLSVISLWIARERRA
ncbi:SPW repeat domain-containing protein [Streptomyces flavidovirens]|uniref:SPW repeat domain-containing protein n=1 Tax=Streptomyces flavidovirens TaxID=67298 RepID=UPI0009970952|nr:SPW repeat protein [Streptomyces flavidovirens]